MRTADSVWMFMMEYQEQHGMPPTLDEISQNVNGLSYRSSAQFAVRALVSQGRVVVEATPGSSRRHRAVPARGDDLVGWRDERELQTHVVPSAPLEA